MQPCIYKYMDMLDIFQRLPPPPMMRNKHMTTDMKANHPLNQSTHSELDFQPISLTPGPWGLCFTVILVPRYLNIFAYIATPLPTQNPAAHRMLALSLSQKTEIEVEENYLRWFNIKHGVMKKILCFIISLFGNPLKQGSIC